MARIILTIPGPWGKPPALESPLELSFHEPDPDLVRDVITLGRRAEVLGDDEVARLRKHQGVVEAIAEFERPGDRTWAAHAARLAAAAMAAGAPAVFVETSLKVFGPATLEAVELDDTATLFHLFVEVMGDDASVSTEGMQSFDLPDVEARYTGDSAAAEVAAFALAAAMVCDRFRPTDGSVFRASESAPFFTCRRRAAAPDADDPFANPRGVWVLEPRVSPRARSTGQPRSSASG